jgi:ferrous iron transport protein B
MLFILYGVYKITFYGSEIPTMMLEAIFSWLTDIFNSVLPDGFVKSLLVNGVIGGVGGIIGFAPLIFIMFIVIAILEDSGYMARMAYMLDRVFRIFGLQGSSVVPFIVSGGIAGGCAVPGVMAARTIKGSKERLLTMLTAPFMPCGAKVPVYAMIIAAFYTGDKGLIMMLITIMSWIVALVMAKFLSKTVVKGDSSSFVMELPPYRLPTIKGVFTHAWERTWMYVKKAGTIILGISILLWFLMSFPGLSEQKINFYEQKRQSIISEYKSKNSAELEKKLARIDVEQAGDRLKNSFAGKIGSFIEPVSELAGFDWRLNIALIGGVMAKEVIISTLGTAYSLEQAAATDEFSSLSSKLKENPNWTIANALALIIFIMLYSPCYMTIMAIIKESGTWKWGVFTLIFYSSLAFSAAVLVYQTFS